MDRRGMEYGSQRRRWWLLYFFYLIYIFFVVCFLVAPRGKKEEGGECIKRPCVFYGGLRNSWTNPHPPSPSSRYRQGSRDNWEASSQKEKERKRERYDGGGIPSENKKRAPARRGKEKEKKNKKKNERTNEPTKRTQNSFYGNRTRRRRTIGSWVLHSEEIKRREERENGFSSLFFHAAGCAAERKIDTIRSSVCFCMWLGGSKCRAQHQQQQQRRQQQKQTTALNRLLEKRTTIVV